MRYIKKKLSVFHITLLLFGVAYGESPVWKNPAWKYFQTGMAYGIQGKFLKARESFTQSLNITPSYKPAKSGIKVINDVLGNRISKQAAIHYFRARGTFYVKIVIHKALIKETSDMLRSNPNDVNAYLLRAKLYFQQRLYRQAIQNYTKVIVISPKIDGAYTNRGIAYAKTGQHELAIKDYNESIRINPKNTNAYFNLGISFIKLRKFKQASRCFSEVIKINPKYRSAYLNRALIHVMYGRNKEAITDYTSMIAINPKNAKAYYGRGYVYSVKLGDKLKGCADFKKACELGMCKNYIILKSQGGCH